MKDPRRRRIGTTNGQCRLTERLVLQIRKAVKEGTRKSVVAREFAVSYTTIRHIVTRQTWTHI